MVPSRLSLGESGRPSLPDTCTQQHNQQQQDIRRRRRRRGWWWSGRKTPPLTHLGVRTGRQASFLHLGRGLLTLPHPPLPPAFGLLAVRLTCRQRRKTAVKNLQEQEEQRGGGSATSVPGRSSGGLLVSVTSSSLFLLLLLLCFLPVSSKVEEA